MTSILAHCSYSTLPYHVLLSVAGINWHATCPCSRSNYCVFCYLTHNSVTVISGHYTSEKMTAISWSILSVWIVSLLERLSYVNITITRDSWLVDLISLYIYLTVHLCQELWYSTKGLSPCSDGNIMVSMAIFFTPTEIKWLRHFSAQCYFGKIIYV